MLLIILTIVVVASLLYYWNLKTFSYWKIRGVKGANVDCIFGFKWKTVFRIRSYAETVEQIYKQCPGTRYSGMYQLSVPTLILRDPELIKQITVKDFDHFTDHKGFIPVNDDPLWGNNLFALKGQKWREMRSILSPSFTSSKMRVMYVLISECAEKFVGYFLGKNEEVVTVEFKDIFTRFTNDVIATTAFGIQVDSLSQPKNEFYMMGKEATNLSGFWNILKFLGFFFCPKIFKVLKVTVFSKQVSEFFKSVVTNTIKVREEKGIVRLDMIHLLMEARKGVQTYEETDVIDTGFSTVQESTLGKLKLPAKLSNTDIAAQAMFFFFGGFDTVSSLMCFLAYELAANPDIQDRLREEVKATLTKYEGRVTYEGLLKMKYLDMIVSETLRKWPIPIVVDRICTKAYTIEPVAPDEKPLHLEKGTVLWLPLFGIHRDAEYYPEPERFDPERFSDENKKRIKPYTYFPFGLGPRNCIGSRFALLETKVLIFYIINSFELVPVEKSRVPLKITRKEFGLNSEGGFWFGMRRIKT